MLSVAFTGITNLSFFSGGMSTQYVHVMQNQAIAFNPDGGADEVTVNLSDTLIFKLTHSSGQYLALKGESEWLDGPPTITWNSNTGEISINYRLKWTNPFAQNMPILVTINDSEASIMTSILTYNQEFVLSALTLNADQLFFVQDANGPWIKGGIGSGEGVVCMGNLAYKYDTTLHPLKDVSMCLYFDGAPDGSQVNVGTDGKFQFNNFVIPLSATGVSKNCEIKVDLAGAIGSAILSSTVIPNTFNVQIDNKPPTWTETGLILVSDNNYESQGRLKPDDGYYGQLTVSVKVDKYNLVTDNTGAGVSPTLSFRAEQINVEGQDVTTSIQTREGVRDIQVLIFDKVHNAATLSVRVSVDVSPPSLFSVYIGQDNDITTNQVLPVAGWFNDETVSFSWTVPADFSLRERPYQVKNDPSPNWSAEQEGTLSDNMFQSTRNTNQLYIEAGGNLAKTIRVRAVDRAGNIREASTTVFVDTTPPTINVFRLKPDLTLEADSLELPEATPNIWYNNGEEVNWTWSAEDNGELPQKPYAYYYNKGNQNVLTSDFTNLSDINIPSDEAPTGNMLTLLVRDKAGNVAISTKSVFVSETAPIMSYKDILFLPDSTDNGGDGVLPEPLWYDQSTLDFVTTLNVQSSVAPLSRIYFKRSIDSTKNILDISTAYTITISDFEIVSNSRTDITFEFVDRAGRGSQVFKNVESSTIVPINLNAALVNDRDSSSQQDGIDPETGYYDSPTISMTWQKPTYWGRLREQPYSININGEGWGSWFGTEGMQLALTPNNAFSLTIRAADMAGNVVTSQILVTVDMEVPIGSFEFIISDDVPHNGGVTPDIGWYSSYWIKGQFLSENVTDLFGLRDSRYFVKNLEVPYGQGSSTSLNVETFSNERGSVINYVSGAIADHAGNIISQQKPVFVDLTPPGSFSTEILADTTDNGYDGFFPEIGWYDEEAVNVEWNHSNDDAQLAEKPYRLSSTMRDWTPFQLAPFFDGLPVYEGGGMTRDVYVQVRDKAGNLTTESMTIRIDITPPEILTFNILPQEQSTVANWNLHIDGIGLPLPNWYNTSSVHIVWETPSENGQLTNRPYRYRAENGQTSFSEWASGDVFAADIRVSANENSPNILYFQALDRAGNLAVLTRSINVDFSPPSMSVQYVAVSNDLIRDFIRPFVTTGDVLWLTLNSHEALVVTPTLVVNKGFYPFEFVEFVALKRVSDYAWTASIDLKKINPDDEQPLYLDGSYQLDVKAYDNAGNMTTTLNGEEFFVVKNDSAPPAENFSLYSTGLEESDTYTKYENVGFSVIKDSKINSFYLTEQSDLSTFEQVESSPYSLRILVSENWNYSFQPDLNTNEVMDGMKTVFLWTALENGIGSDVSVSAKIRYDHTAAFVSIEPDYMALQGRTDGVSLSVGTYHCRMTLRSNVIGYREEAIETPSWRLLLPAVGESFITVDLLPSLEDLSDRSKWVATYNSALSTASGNAIFLVAVTDNALNPTTQIKEGERFNIDLQAAGNPSFSVRSLDGREGYTRFLTVNIEIQNDSSETIYDYYKITDGLRFRPSFEAVNTQWESNESPTIVSFRIDAVFPPDEVLEGGKTIYVWSRISFYINPEIIERRITYDKTPPSLNIIIAPYLNKTNSQVDEVLRVTMSVSEELETTNSQTLFLKDESRSTLSTSNWLFEKKNAGVYTYVSTLNIPGANKFTNVSIQTLLSDWAGNTTNHTQAVRQLISIKEFKDEVPSAASFVEQGKPDFLVMSCVLSANDLAIHLRGIRIQLAGSYQPIDFNNFKVFLDGNNDGQFNYDSGYGFDSLKGMSSGGIDQTGIVSISFLSEEMIPSNSSKRFFIVADVSAGAVQRDTFTMKFLSYNAFEVADNEMVDYANAPNEFRTKQIMIVKTISGVYLVPQIGSQTSSNRVSQNVNRGGSNQLLNKFTLYTDKGVALWSGLKLRYSGTLGTEHLNLSLYKDTNLNGYFEPDGDGQISYPNNRFEAGQSVMTLNLKENQLINAIDSDKMTYFLVGDIQLDTPLASTFNLAIFSSNEVLVDTPNQVVSSLLPYRTAEFKVKDYVSKITISVANNPQQDVFQGDSIILQKLLFDLDLASAAQLTHLDYYFDGTVNPPTDFQSGGGDSGIALYRLSSNMTLTQDFEREVLFDATKIAATNSWSDGNHRLRINFSTEQPLTTHNLFALVVTVNDGSTPGRQFGFTSHLEVVSQNPYIGFVGAIAKQDQTFSTNYVEIVGDHSPSQPKVSMNYYNRFPSKLPLSFDTYTKYGAINLGVRSNQNNNDVVAYSYSIGTIPDLGDVASLTQIDLIEPYPIKVDVKADILNLGLLPDHLYYLTFRSIATRSDNSGNLYSKPVVIPFMTDFSPPHLPNYPIDVQIDGTNHLLSWEDFFDPVSGIKRFYIEEKSNYIPSWNLITLLPLVSDPMQPKISERYFSTQPRKPNMSYSYRVKAENQAGLMSDYIYSTPITTVDTDKVLSNVSNFPNPFNSRKEKTTLFYYLNQDTGIETRIFDSMGHFVRKYNYTVGIIGKTVKGDCTMEWDGKNEQGEYVAKGGYFVVIEAPDSKGDDKKVVRMIGVIH